jgi:hypothetical protein
MEAAQLVADLARGLPPVSGPPPGETVAAVRVRDLQPVGQPRPGTGVAAARVPPDMLSPSLGCAVVHQRREGAVIYCDASQITGPAADTLAAFAGRAAVFAMAADRPGVLRYLSEETLAALGASGRAKFAMPEDGDGECQVSVITVRCRKLPFALHPALATARAGQVEAYVCERQITAGLAATLSALGSAYAWCQGAGAALGDASGWGP